MTIIRNSYSNQGNPVRVSVPANVLMNYLMDVKKCSGSYPMCERVDSLGNNVYKWTMTDRKVGTTHFKAIQVNKYNKSGNTVSWEAVKGSGENMYSSGHFTVKPAGQNACDVSVEVVQEVDVPIPSIMAGFAEKMGEREIQRAFMSYLESIKKSVETGKLVKEEAELDSPAVSESFEKKRLSRSQRTKDYKSVVTDYYKNVTEVYQSGWGDHFHFGVFESATEPLERGIKRVEEKVVKSALIDENCYVLDVGCGVGGPTCNISLLTGATVRGLNISPDQVEIARERCKKLGLEHKVFFDVGDALNMPYPDNTFDVVTFFESICHVPDKLKYFKECFRVLKPGGRISGVDWLNCHNPTEKEILDYLEPICAHHAVPEMGSLITYRQFMEDAGFFVHMSMDLRMEGDILRNWEVLDEKTVSSFKQLPKDEVDPKMEMMIAGGIALSEGARAGAFVLGRFLGMKPVKPNAGPNFASIKPKL